MYVWTYVCVYVRFPSHWVALVWRPQTSCHAQRFLRIAGTASRQITEEIGVTNTFTFPFCSTQNLCHSLGTYICMYVCKYVCMENQTQTSLRFLGERPCKYIHSHMYECVHGSMYVHMLISSALSHISFMYVCMCVRCENTHLASDWNRVITSSNSDCNKSGRWSFSEKTPYTLVLRWGRRNFAVSTWA